MTLWRLPPPLLMPCHHLACSSPYHNPNLCRAQVLQALGSSVRARGSRSLLQKEASVSTWAACAVSVYRDMAVKGWKPNYDVLNM